MGFYARTSQKVLDESQQKKTKKTSNRFLVFTFMKLCAGVFCTLSVVAIIFQQIIWKPEGLHLTGFFLSINQPLLESSVNLLDVNNDARFRYTNLNHNELLGAVGCFEEQMVRHRWFISHFQSATCRNLVIENTEIFFACSMDICVWKKVSFRLQLFVLPHISNV